MSKPIPKKLCKYFPKCISGTSCKFQHITADETLNTEVKE